MQDDKCSYSVFKSECFMQSAPYFHPRLVAECYKYKFYCVNLKICCILKIKDVALSRAPSGGVAAQLCVAMCSIMQYVLRCGSVMV